jgi:hypothetical protein
VSTIRPPIFPTTQQPVQAQPSARGAAQRAFFAAATGAPAVAAQPRAAAQSQAQPQATAKPVHRMPTSLPAEPPEKILRPGSILDIRV